LRLPDEAERGPAARFSISRLAFAAVVLPLHKLNRVRVGIARDKTSLEDKRRFREPDHAGQDEVVPAFAQSD